ncbi:hypothetical protein [Paraburkholderia sp.]|uniref:hypothetical protein n=1 Tax=Paraburkholderia sp. TaxID=1926495 RepID=UPI0025D84E94|nr:hypothetical protein [Paraburkholderia sp.]
MYCSWSARIGEWPIYPDFVERRKANAAMNEPHREGFFGGTEKFYTGYPTLSEAQAI